MVPGSLSTTALEKEGDVCVKYSSSPLGEGKGGSRYIQRTKLPALGPWIGDARPPQTWEVTEQVWGSGVGSAGGKGLLRKEDKDGVLGSGCLGLSIPLLPSEVLCRLVFFLLLLLRSELGQGNKGRTLEGAAPRSGGSHGSPSQLRGWHRAPWQAFNKLLVILTDPRTHAF